MVFVSDNVPLLCVIKLLLPRPSTYGTFYEDLFKFYMTRWIKTLHYFKCINES